VTPDAIIVGAGPNGLAAAIALARAGLAVTVFEEKDTVGGSCKSAALTLPGFLHDTCAAVFPLAVASPFFRTLPLADHGLEWIHPETPLAHPFDDGSAVLLERSLPDTAAGLGEDAAAYRSMMQPLIRGWERIEKNVLGPWAFPRYPLALARFGMQALRPARNLAESRFQNPAARALFAGMAAHSMLPLEQTLTAGFGLVLGIAAHAAGWPIARGGAQSITRALASYLESLGGRIETGHPVSSLDELPPSRVMLCDISPRQLLQIAGRRLPEAYKRKIERYRYGMAAYKVDWALDAPIPWIAPECARAGTLHLGGTLEEIAEGERAVAAGQPPDRPYVLLSQPSLFDPSRAPAGKHTAWAYCHVPNGSDFDMLPRIENQIERFAPGFRERILARSVRGPAELERANANLVGGDLNGGMQDLRQAFFRPTARLYSTPVKNLFLCSSSTPPGGGVHGMCGYHAAQAALRSLG
jgi:phytoene dehydrogenase-like protein